MALTAMALAVPAAAPSVDAAEKAIWGPTALPGGGSAFPVYRELGVDTYQMSFDFSSIAPTRPANPSNPSDPAYRWPTNFDDVLAQARRNGVKLAVLLDRSPPWANGGRSRITAPRPGDFAAFAAAASRRYPSVRRWMIWGEPNRDDRFQPNGSGSPVAPRTYAPILDASYVSLKGVSRRNIVIGGMTWTGGTVKPARFLRYMRLPNGRRPRLDWFGHNPFPFRFPNLSELNVAGGYRDISDLDLFARELHGAYTRRCTRAERRQGKRRCGRRPRLWLSEFNVQSDHSSRLLELFVSRSEQGRWLRAAYAIADMLPSVAGLGWLALVDESDPRSGANWGLLTSAGARKPSFGEYLRAPSQRFRPRVRVGRLAVRGRGLLVRVRPRSSGKVRVELRSPAGRLLASKARRGSRGSSTRVRLRWRAARRGRATLIVRAPRGSRVRSEILVR